MAITSFIITAFLVGAYLLPTLIAAKKEKSNLTAITVLNILLGWTLIGWIIALIWACTKDKN